MVQVYTRHACCVWQVVEDVLSLNGIARHLKAGRASNGALRLDNTKLYFKMDDNGNPVSAAPYGECHAHQLIHLSLSRKPGPPSCAGTHQRMGFHNCLASGAARCLCILYLCTLCLCVSPMHSSWAAVYCMTACRPLHACLAGDNCMPHEFAKLGSKSCMKGPTYEYTLCCRGA